MSSLRVALPFLLCSSLVFAQGGSPQSKPSDLLNLDTITSEVFQAVKQETGVDLKGKIQVRWGTALDFAKVLTKDSQDLSSVPFGKKTLKKLRKQHRIIGTQLLGKFDWRKNEILIGRTNLEKQARLFKKPKLLEPQTIKALLTHESMHAVDQSQYHWVEKMKDLGSSKIKLYNAVVEGHAQAVAERICKAQGWEKGFSVFSSVIGKIPDSTKGLMRQLLEIRIAQTRDAYWKGRSFVIAVEKALGKRGLKRIFEHPPSSFDQVLHPEWYLHPEKAPQTSFDPSPAFKAFLEGIPRKEWRARRIKASLSQLGAALTLLPEKEKKWILESLLGNRTLVVMDRKNPQARMMVFSFLQFKTPEDAKFYLKSGLKLSKIKDQKMAKGRVRITESSYEDFRGKGKPMVYIGKTVAVGGQTVAVKSLLITRENLALEILYSNAATTKEKLLSLGPRLIKKVILSTKGGDPVPPKAGLRQGSGK